MIQSLLVSSYQKLGLRLTLLICSQDQISVPHHLQMSVLVVKLLVRMSYERHHSSKRHRKKEDTSRIANHINQSFLTHKFHCSHSK